MNSIINGAIKFMHEDFLEQKDLFEKLSSSQDPHTLFIGCSDSRVVPNLITSTLPGELFVVRNIANIVPVYKASNEYLATTSAIEYAINALNVRNIVICGHSNCGGCESIYHPQKLESLPTVKNWLWQLNDIKEEVLKAQRDFGLSEQEKYYFTQRLNILTSLENIKTYPNVQEKMQKNELNLHGWHYVIDSGQVFAYDGNSFKLLSNSHKGDKNGI